jgi:hypothetical protein
MSDELSLEQAQRESPAGGPQAIPPDWPQFGIELTTGQYGPWVWWPPWRPWRAGTARRSGTACGWGPRLASGDCRPSRHWLIGAARRGGAVTEQPRSGT